MSLGKRLQDARKKLNITQEQLADSLEVTRQSVSRWESDIVYPDMANLVKLSNILEVSIDYLLKNETNLDTEKKVNRLLLTLVGKEVKLEFNTSQDYDFFQSKKKIIVIEVSKDWIKLESVDRKTEESKIKLVPVETIKSITLKEED
ncbi:MAG: helix-turn-helix domain-containing protein [Anaeroplasmataceae bacterium]|nr:helix-turn-helix domain-containing protein [Anaeroplasmataceae bacterium]